MAAMRDADRFKDKIEVSLDSRQIFFLFFGGAVVACLVFVLGVMVGKRLEGREQVAKRAATTAAIDPLAALDELGADEQADDMAFASALTGDPEEKAKPLGQADVAPMPKPVPPQPKPQVAVAPAPEPDPDPEPVPAPPPPKPDKKKSSGGKFTLQLSSFQSRAEADDFVGKLAPAGYKPYIIQSEVPGRGIFFRVRIGEYPSMEDALAAKGEFEAQQHIIAYVTKL